jgi:hypothetical protein
MPEIVASRGSGGVVISAQRGVTGAVKARAHLPKAIRAGF